MARGRFVSRTISEDEAVTLLSDKAALLYTWMIPHLDCEGKICSRSDVVKGKVVPYRDTFSIPVIERCLQEIAKTPLVVRYGKNGMYMKFNGFLKNNSIRKDKEARSRIPDPTPGVSTGVSTVPTPGVSTDKVQDKLPELLRKSENASLRLSLSLRKEPVSQEAEPVDNFQEMDPPAPPPDGPSDRSDQDQDVEFSKPIPMPKAGVFNPIGKSYFDPPTDDQSKEIAMFDLKLRRPGFGLLRFLGWVKKQKGYPPTADMVLNICRHAVETRPADMWAYFVGALSKALPQAFADLTIRQAQAMKRMGMPQNLKDILATITQGGAVCV